MSRRATERGRQPLPSQPQEPSCPAEPNRIPEPPDNESNGLQDIPSVAPARLLHACENKITASSVALWSELYPTMLPVMWWYWRAWPKVRPALTRFPQPGGAGAREARGPALPDRHRAFDRDRTFSRPLCELCCLIEPLCFA